MRNPVPGVAVLVLVLLGCGKDPSPGGPAGPPPPPPSSHGRPRPLAVTAEQDLPSGYAGSSACKDCHEPEYFYWMRTPHSYMARTAEFERQVPDSPMGSPDFPYPEEDVAIVLGTLKKQVYLTKVGDEYHFLPRQYNLATEAWGPFDIDEWEPPLTDGSPHPTWNGNCAGCHTTGYDPSRRSFVELSVGCEECHGPGARHARTRSRDDIVNPRSLPPHLAMSICAQCHARGAAKKGGLPFASDFLPGQDISSYMVHVEPRYGENTPFFWGNGMAAKHHQQYQEFTQSRHYLVGVTCLDCHKGHRLKLRKPPSRSRLTLMTVERQFLAARAHSVCVTCHIRDESEGVARQVTTLFSDVEAHTHHPSHVPRDLPAPDGGPDVAKREMLCNDCHMPRTAPDELRFSMHTHTFRVPDIIATELYGVPNGCTWCHTDRDAAWATNQIREIWLTGDLVRDHSVRFAEEFAAIQEEWAPPTGYLAGVPADRYPEAPALLAQIASLEEVAGVAAKIAGTSLGRATPRSEIDYAAHEAIRRAETEIYHLCRDLLDLRRRIASDLRSTVDAGPLAALNHLLDATGKPPWEIPEAVGTYADGESLYREFNSRVQVRGAELFDGWGLKTTWQDWLGIHAELKAGKLTKTYAEQLDELADKGIIRYEVRLKE